MEIFAIIISLLALVFTIVTYFCHEMKLKMQTEVLNSYQIEIYELQKKEKKQAFIETKLLKMNNGTRTIRIYNSGMSEARKVQVIIPEIDSIKILSELAPIDLKPNQSFDISIALTINYPNILELEFNWQDDFRKSNVETQAIQL